MLDLQQKAAELVQQMHQIDAELLQARQRVNYLEQQLLRADGALSLLKQLLEATPAVSVDAVDHMPQPVAS